MTPAHFRSTIRSASSGACLCLDWPLAQSDKHGTTLHFLSPHLIRQRIPEFNPPGLDQFVQQQKAQTNVQAKEITDRIERNLQKVILEELRRECGKDELGWWMLGVPVQIRKKVSERFEEDGGKRGGKEYYFDLIDYAKIAAHNWELFEPVLAYEKSGAKDKRLSWINFVNEKRNIVSHPSGSVSVTTEELEQLRGYEEWLDKQISAPSKETTVAPIQESE